MFKIGAFAIGKFRDPNHSQNLRASRLGEDMPLVKTLLTIVCISFSYLVNQLTKRKTNSLTIATKNITLLKVIRKIKITMKIIKTIDILSEF